MNHLTNLYKNKCQQLQEQINHLNKLLLEVNETEYNGTGNTPPPTVIRFDDTRSPKDNPDNFKTRAHDENEDWEEGRDYFTDWINEEAEYMRRAGATPEQIANIVKLLRQQYLLLKSGSQGSMPSGEIRMRMREYYSKILNQQQFWKDFIENKDQRKTINNGIDRINKYIRPTGTIPVIPNINPLPWSAY